MSISRAEQLGRLAAILADYRQGEIQPRTPELIDRWLSQFPATDQMALLTALVHVLGKTYISRDHFKRFLAALATTDKLSPGTQPSMYWRAANYLNIQQGGSSQADILGTFDEVLHQTHGFGLESTGSPTGDFVYLDDCIGTGSRVRSDVCTWLDTVAQTSIRLHIVTPVLYLGSWWIDKKIAEKAASVGKTVAIKKWRLDHFQMENRLNSRNSADVLWPTAIPSDPSAQAYAATLQATGHPASLRTPGNLGASGIFADDAQKILLEQAFLTLGCQLRQECGNLPDRARPLGYHNLDCLGFGSMFVTYRNCPNNCPLALWVEQSSYPSLLPRKTNSQSADERLMREMFS